MVIAHHLILTGYGRWLPNDPRGSHSTDIRAGKLFLLGTSTTAPGSRSHPARKSVSTVSTPNPCWSIPSFGLMPPNGKPSPTLSPRSLQTGAIAVTACAILTNHAHLVIRRHRDKAETISSELKVASATRLRQVTDVPESHPVWSSDKFKGFRARRKT